MELERLLSEEQKLMELQKQNQYEQNIQKVDSRILLTKSDASILTDAMVQYVKFAKQTYKKQNKKVPIPLQINISAAQFRLSQITKYLNNEIMYAEEKHKPC